MPGPPKQPVSLALMKGNPGHRPLNKREPQPKAVAPHCPDHLDEAAKTEWDRLVPILLDMRVLTEADYIGLANLCCTYSTMAKAQKSLSETGVLAKSPSGYIYQSPLLGIVNTCIQTITTLCREFGLSPSARARVQTIEEETKTVSPWAAVRNTSNGA